MTDVREERWPPVGNLQLAHRGGVIADFSNHVTKEMIEDPSHPFLFRWVELICHFRLAERVAAAEGGTRVVGFVRAKETEPKVTSKAVENQANPDEIEIGSDDDSDEEEGASNAMDVDGAKEPEPESEVVVGGLEKRDIPEGVFGGLGADAAQAQEKLGAKERFKRKR
ncbi:hypothetical protein HDU87_004965 [Geranomyces variabilis]|uniref:Uncharacterized protein n=1 Tax=Geranomyces variabilis TaxID=109894 RepID=A0AAD5TJ36_9FUNG|nr:hypothetical protein HDU87_004965 [Geranomyces variabilis]